MYDFSGVSLRVVRANSAQFRSVPVFCAIEMLLAARGLVLPPQ